jgi:hypothetical protein
MDKNELGWKEDDAAGSKAANSPTFGEDNTILVTAPIALFCVVVEANEIGAEQ